MIAGALKNRALQMPAFVAVALGVVCVFLIAALLAPIVAPLNPTDISTFNLGDAEIPPLFAKGGDARFPLGTDNQGRDLLSAIIYGARISIVIGGGAVLFAAVFGVTLGLIAGFFGGWVDALIMRIADVILSFPTILLALLVSGIARVVFPASATPEWAPIILISAIGIHDWVQYARTVRAATMVETAKDYVRAVKVIGLPPHRIIGRHILPNVMAPVLVIATINLATAMLTEATLSFLGVGMPPTYPSLGTLIRVGNEFLFSGVWWIAIFPAVVLVSLILALNVVGDWLRDQFNPKLRTKL
jgi:peptide/nickel transport system permease protein